MDSALRDLELIAKQEKSEEAIRKWLMALIRAGQKLPISTKDWQAYGAVGRGGNKFDQSVVYFPTNICQHRHDTERKAVACIKRKCYTDRKEKLTAQVIENRPIDMKYVEVK